MSITLKRPVWRSRYKKIPRKFDELKLPRMRERLTQDKEWCVIIDCPGSAEIGQIGLMKLIEDS